MSLDEVRAKLVELVEPFLENRGLELVHLDYKTGKKGHLCLYIDKPGGVTLTDCETVNRDVSDLLDAYDPVPHSYILEVSSPGVERPLTREKDFHRFEGEKIKVSTGEPIEGKKKFNGTLHGVRNGCIIMLLENGEKVEIPFPRIIKAHLQFNS